MFASPSPKEKKKKLNLTPLKIYNAPLSNKRPIKTPPPSPTKPLSPRRVQKDFKNTNPSIRFMDKKDRPTTLFDNQYTLRSVAAITPGAHAHVEHEKLISPTGTSSMPLVVKQGTTPVDTEIK